MMTSGQFALVYRIHWTTLYSRLSLKVIKTLTNNKNKYLVGEHCFIINSDVESNIVGNIIVLTWANNS